MPFLALALKFSPGNPAAGSLVDRSFQTTLAKSYDDIGMDQTRLGQLTEGRAQYERALALDPNLSDAHYRLGTDYVHVGNKENAQKEFAVYQKLRAEHLAEVDREAFGALPDEHARVRSGSDARRRAARDERCATT